MGIVSVGGGGTVEVGGRDLVGGVADTAAGSECDIINHEELPPAGIAGISVSRTVKGRRGGGRDARGGRVGGRVAQGGVTL